MNNTEHKVLALKYRPKNFKELIGQDVMVETITNSIKINKLPNAYLLTGIRGVGKTTTARLIAKAINCNKNFIEAKPGEYCRCSSCEEISNSKHLDVLEMDAASKTGIDDIRELIDSSRYNPTSAKYKIYIIDEIHMLSRQAFNGLLKTLEEPPPHLKFIFATTEVKKIPLTIISRCQRFDLHRVNINVLIENLKKISINEKGKISSEALKLIAKVAEGSVRDSLSLLDRALVNQQVINKEIDEIFVRKMLGIADRTKIVELLNSIFHGDQKIAIKNLRLMFDEGLEPENFLNDLLEIIYFLLQSKNLGDVNNDLAASESEQEMINQISKTVETSTLMIFWQFVLKAMEELSIVSNPILSTEMLVIRLLHLKDMPSYESVLNSLNKSNFNLDENNKSLDKDLIERDQNSKTTKDQIKNTTQRKPNIPPLETQNLTDDSKLENISSFEDLIKISSKKREIELKYDLERNVNLVNFSQGKIDINLNDKLGKNFVRNLSEKLLEWTGKRWVITLTKEIGKRSFSETKSEEKKFLFENEKKGEVYKKFKDVFSDAELTEVLKKD
ncbi:MAG: DNA polymerase-3 subunit gamma/tau [Pelagibacterales bacterium]|nr:DNA polymerase-3 subunit gamma/tau [Pelagibacterales bacterium]